MKEDEKRLDEILGVLKDIRKGIDILVFAQKDKALEGLNKVRGKRKQMYEMFDGKTSLEAIAKRLGTTHENVRLFGVECEKKCLVEFVKGKGRTKYPKKLF
jgi:hypothetical protein